MTAETPRRELGLLAEMEAYYRYQANSFDRTEASHAFYIDRADALREAADALEARDAAARLAGRPQEPQTIVEQHRATEAAFNAHPDLLLRTLLWLTHGCPSSALYGDDGERQCSACGIDFKRFTPENIEARLYERGRKRLEKELAAAAGPAPETPLSADALRTRQIVDAMLRSAERQLERYAICPDHRDKGNGTCIVCRFERSVREQAAPVPAAAPPALAWTDEQLRHAIEMADPTEWANGDRVYRLTNADCDAMRAVLITCGEARSELALEWLTLEVAERAYHARNAAFDAIYMEVQDMPEVAREAGWKAMRAVLTQAAAGEPSK